MSLYKLGISDKTIGAMQNADPEVQKMMLESQQNNTQPNSSGGILDIIKELFGFGSAGASDLGSIANLGKTASTQSANPSFKVSTMYDQIYSDPFNIKPRDSEIIIGADDKAKTVPILPMSPDEIMAGSIIPPDFNTERFQSIFPTSGIMSQTQFVEDNDLEASAIPRFGEGELKQSRGIGDLFRAALGFVIPGASLFMGDRSALQGIRSLNQRLRNTDFGRSKNLMDYLDIKSYGGYDEREDARRATMKDAARITSGLKRTAADDVIDRGRGSIPSRSSPTTSKRDTSPSSSYSQASYARRR